MSHGSGRIHYMDAMRATLMMFGIVLHSSQIFNPAQTWVIGSEQTFPLAGWLVDAIGIFRMPAFFIVAGFFCLLSMQKYTPRDFATMRVERLAVPLVVCALLLNSLQAAILSSYGVLDFNLGAVACLVLTAIVTWLALRCALPTERVKEILSKQDTSEDEDAPKAH